MSQMKNKEKKYVFDDDQLMSEWHWERNDALGYDPRLISYGSTVKVWWKCEKGHEWEATVSKRSSGRGCPYCSGKNKTIKNG